MNYAEKEKQETLAAKEKQETLAAKRPGTVPMPVPKTQTFKPPMPKAPPTTPLGTTPWRQENRAPTAPTGTLARPADTDTLRATEAQRAGSQQTADQATQQSLMDRMAQQAAQTQANIQQNAPTQSGALEDQQRAAEMQRSTIRREAQREREQAQEAIARRMAGQGFAAGSGMLEATQAEQEALLRQGEQGRLGEVDVAQAQAQAQLREAAAAREQAKVLTAAQLEQQANLTMEDLAQSGSLERARQEIQKSEIARQEISEREARDLEARMADARNSLEYQQIASTEGVAEAERRTRYSIEQENFQQQEKERQQKYGFAYDQLIQEASNFGREMGLREEEARATAEQVTNQLLWEREKYGSEYSWRAEELTSNQDFQIEIANLNDSIERGQLNLADQIQQNTEKRKMEYDTLYNRGASGEDLDTSGMSDRQKYAYQAGMSRVNKDQFDRDIQQQLDLQNSMIVNAAEPVIVQRVMDIYAQWGITPATI